MLLGMPFLKATNPNIDWTNGTCEGKVEASTPEAHYKPLANYAVEATQMKEELQEANYSSKYTNLEAEEQLIVRRTTHRLPKKRPWDRVKKLAQQLIARRTTKATTLAAEKAEQVMKPWKELIPAEYHKYGKVFSEKKSHRLPMRKPWDHAIELVHNAPAILNCKIYPLAEGQQELLNEFLIEHLAKGYIRRSKSPYASPFFFVGKKDAKK